MRELSQLSREILAEGKLTEDNARFFADWVRWKAGPHPEWPLYDVLERVNRVFALGTMSEDERKEIESVLKTLSGKKREPLGHSMPKGLPFTFPAPDPVLHSGRSFALTGKFNFGPRALIHMKIRERGGKMPRDCAISETTDYLIVGEKQGCVRSVNHWSGSIWRAVHLRGAGQNVAIISETHWGRFV